MNTFLKLVTAALFLFLLPMSGSVFADVVRPAPNFTWQNATGSSINSLDQLNNRSAILIITPNVEDRAFRYQLREMDDVYSFLAANKAMVFIAYSQTATLAPSNIPYVIVSEGAQVASAFGSSDHFGIAIIGRDGNLDYFSNKVVSGQRILDIVNNSFVVQRALRRE